MKIIWNALSSVVICSLWLFFFSLRLFVLYSYFVHFQVKGMELAHWKWKEWTRINFWRWWWILVSVWWWLLVSVGWEICWMFDVNFDECLLLNFSECSIENVGRYLLVNFCIVIQAKICSCWCLFSLACYGCSFSVRNVVVTNKNMSGIAYSCAS